MGMPPLLRRRLTGSCGCRAVLAREQLFLEYVKVMAPVCDWVEQSRDPKRFVKLTDRILDVADLLLQTGAALPDESRRRCEQASRICAALKRGDLVVPVFDRSVPYRVGESMDAASLKQLVRYLCAAAAALAAADWQPDGVVLKRNVSLLSVKHMLPYNGEL